jgi:hypothetical protein
VSDKDFKVKNKLQVKGITSAGPVVADASGNIDSTSSISTQYGGTGTTTSPNAGQILYSASGTTYTPTTLTSLVVPTSYSDNAPSNPVLGQIWIESDSSSDSFDPNLIRRQAFTATAGQTVFTTSVNFVDGYEQVFFNGLLLLRTTDYTTSNSNTITLGSAAAANDIIEVVTITNLNSTNTYTQAEINSAISAHSNATTNVHGIADTSLLATQSYVQANKGVTVGNTSSRPGSPSVGTLYFDTTLDTLIQYKSTGWSVISPVPNAPTSVSATLNSDGVSASVSFTAPTNAAVTSYTVTSSPGSITATGTSSPITVSGFSYGTNYTFTVTALGSNGTSVASSASNSVTSISIFNVDYLVVAGGGGGGAGDGDTAQGGGGAGGYRTSIGGTALSIIPNTSYTATVGSGGNGGVSSSTNVSTSGSNSVFSTITSIGGGYGANYNNSPRVSRAAASGGSGGGGALENQTGAAGTAGQGNSGGNQAVDIRSGGGGGGAGAVGGNNPDISTGGAGGAGLSNSISGSSVIYAGGGGGGGRNTGGAGGAGGGGNGANSNGSGSNGTANRGGGGGGQSNSGSTPNGATGGNGGSGIVILKYPDSRTITLGVGLTGSTASPSSGFKVTTITAGTGNVSWS